MNIFYITGERKFICTQAPIESTIDDFWRMVWQANVDAIVMLCGITEKGKPKLTQYWPEHITSNRVMIRY